MGRRVARFASSPLIHDTIPVLLCLVAFTLRIMALDRQGFWGDEGHSVYLAGLSAGQIGTGPFSDQMPFYYLLLKWWMALAGDSEFVVRYLSAFCGVLSVPLIYMLARRLLDRPASLAAFGLAAIAPPYVWVGREARSYALLVLLALVMLLALEAATRRPTAKLPWAVYAIFATLGVYTHMSIAPLVVLWPPVALWLVQGRQGNSQSIFTAKRFTVVAACVPPLALVAAAFAPWLLLHAQDIVQVQQLAAAQAGAITLPAMLANLAIVFATGISVARVDVDLTIPANAADYRLALLLVVPFVLLALRGSFYRAGNHRSGMALAAMLLVPVIFMYLYASGRHDLHPRYLIATSPFWILLVAAGLAESRRWWALTATAGVVILAVNGLALWNYFADARFAGDDWRGAMRYVRAEARAGDAILVDGPYTQPVIDYYNKGGAATVYRLPDERPLDPDHVRALLSDIARQHRTVWLIFWQDFYNDPQRVSVDYLERHGALMDEKGFRGVSLFRRYSTSSLLMDTDFVPSYPVGASFENGTRLLGYDLDESEVAATSRLYVTLYWQVAKPVTNNCRVFVHLINSAYTAWGNADGVPGYYRFSTTRWEPGTIVRDEYAVRVLSGTPPGEYELDVGMYDAANGQRQRIVGQKADHLILAPVKIAPQQADPVPAKKSAVKFGDRIELVGSEIPSGASPGGALQVTLFWRADKPVGKDYTVFVHLTDNEGRPLAQRDSQPADGNYPMSAWVAGYSVRDQYRIPLPADLPQGEYRLRVGVYEADSGMRLPVRNAARGVDYYELGSIAIGQ